MVQGVLHGVVVEGKLMYCSLEFKSVRPVKLGLSQQFL